MGSRNLLHRPEPSTTFVRIYNVLPEEPLTEDIMAWTTPTLVEICVGLEINGYLPAEF